MQLNISLNKYHLNYKYLSAILEYLKDQKKVDNETYQFVIFEISWTSKKRKKKNMAIGMFYEMH